MTTQIVGGASLQFFSSRPNKGQRLKGFEIDYPIKKLHLVSIEYILKPIDKDPFKFLEEKLDREYFSLLMSRDTNLEDLKIKRDVIFNQNMKPVVLIYTNTVPIKIFTPAPGGATIKSANEVIIAKNNGLIQIPPGSNKNFSVEMFGIKKIGSQISLTSALNEKSKYFTESDKSDVLFDKNDIPQLNTLIHEKLEKFKPSMASKRHNK